MKNQPGMQASLTIKFMKFGVLPTSETVIMRNNLIAIPQEANYVSYTDFNSLNLMVASTSEIFMKRSKADSRADIKMRCGFCFSNNSRPYKAIKKI